MDITFVSPPLPQFIVIALTVSSSLYSLSFSITEVFCNQMYNTTVVTHFIGSRGVKTVFVLTSAVAQYEQCNYDPYFMTLESFTDRMSFS